MRSHVRVLGSPKRVEVLPERNVYQDVQSPSSYFLEAHKRGIVLSASRREPKMKFEHATSCCHDSRYNFIKLRVLLRLQQLFY